MRSRISGLQELRSSPRKSLPPRPSDKGKIGNSTSPGSQKKLLKNPEFIKLNQSVQDAMVRALNLGTATVKLDSRALRRIPLYSPSDLQYSFCGTQGLVITGSGKLPGGHYAGTLTYKIEDSYGFSTSDIFFKHIGQKLRYLQTVCGNPPNPAGAHWFRDSVTITVHFKLLSLLA